MIERNVFSFAIPKLRQLQKQLGDTLIVRDDYVQYRHKECAASVIATHGLFRRVVAWLAHIPRPLSLARRAVLLQSTVNSVPVFGDAPRMWLCVQIDGTRNPGDDIFDVTYVFRRASAGWDATVIDAGVATKYRVYREVDWPKAVYLPVSVPESEP